MAGNEEMWASSIDTANEEMWCSDIDTANEEMWLSDIGTAITEYFRLLLKTAGSTCRLVTDTVTYRLKTKPKVGRLETKRGGRI